MIGLVLLGLGMAGAIGFDFVTRGVQRFPVNPQWPMGDADANRGKALLTSYGCGACHVIPGIRQATGRVGPKLEDLVHQMYIAGMLRNTPDDLMTWIQHPQEINPLTAMPTLGVTEEDARDMVAYLYSQ